MAHTFHVTKSNHSHIHLKWNNALKPVLTVESGTEVSFDLLDGGHNQFTETSTSADVPNFNLALVRARHITHLANFPTDYAVSCRETRR